jgi:hypothetical protein
LCGRAGSRGEHFRGAAGQERDGGSHRRGEKEASQTEGKSRIYALGV